MCTKRQSYTLTVVQWKYLVNACTSLRCSSLWLWRDCGVCVCVRDRFYGNCEKPITIIIAMLSAMNVKCFWSCDFLPSLFCRFVFTKFTPDSLDFSSFLLLLLLFRCESFVGDGNVYTLHTTLITTHAKYVHGFVSTSEKIEKKRTTNIGKTEILRRICESVKIVLLRPKIASASLWFSSFVHLQTGDTCNSMQESNRFYRVHNFQLMRLR